MTTAPGTAARAPDFSAHPVATIVLDDSGGVLAVNPAAQNLLEMGEGAVIGKPVGGVIPDFAQHSFAPPRTIVAHDVALALANREKIVDIVGESDGDGITVLALIPLARGVGGPRRGAKAQPAAVGAATILAHEIKNPLSGIRGAAQLLAAGTSDPDRFTGLICREVDRIAALIDRMEILSSEQHLALKPASVFPPVRHALDIARAGFAAEIDIEENHDPSLPMALLDDDALVQLLLNLVKNAIEALAGVACPRITVAAAYRHGHFVEREEGEGFRELPIMLTITDNGPGVPAHILPDLFRPFASARSGGTGLGLAIAERLVRDMGGAIDYDRDEKHGLTHFRIMLERAP